MNKNNVMMASLLMIFNLGQAGDKTKACEEPAKYHSSPRMLSLYSSAFAVRDLSEQTQEKK